jgi:hypothetical protein
MPESGGRDEWARAHFLFAQKKIDLAVFLSVWRTVTAPAQSKHDKTGVRRKNYGLAD